MATLERTSRLLSWTLTAHCSRLLRAENFVRSKAEIRIGMPYMRVFLSSAYMMGWKEVLKQMQGKGISLAIVSAAKAELIEKTLTHFGIECDAIYKEAIPTPYGKGFEKTESATRRGYLYRRRSGGCRTCPKCRNTVLWGSVGLCRP